MNLLVVHLWFARFDFCRHAGLSCAGLVGMLHLVVVLVVLLADVLIHRWSFQYVPTKVYCEVAVILC